MSNEQSEGDSTRSPSISTAVEKRGPGVYGSRKPRGGCQDNLRKAPTWADAFWREGQRCRERYPGRREELYVWLEMGARSRAWQRHDRTGAGNVGELSDELLRAEEEVEVDSGWWMVTRPCLTVEGSTGP